jgi:hypothetical protein
MDAALQSSFDFWSRSGCGGLGCPSSLKLPTPLQYWNNAGKSGAHMTMREAPFRGSGDHVCLPKLENTDSRR